jgi:apolipoprotein N-acyltransferase
MGTVPHQKAGAIEVAIPEPLPPTFFSRWGNWLAGLTALLLAGAAIAIRRRHR